MLHSQATFCMLHSEMFYKKGVLKNFAKFMGRHLCQSLFFSVKLQALGMQLY